MSTVLRFDNNEDQYIKFPSQGYSHVYKRLDNVAT